MSAQATLRLDEQQRTIGDHGWFIEEQRPLLATLPELRAHLTVLQRATAMLQRRLGEAAPAAAATTAAAPAAAAAGTSGGSPDDYKYVGFEDQFRGSEESVAATFDEYLPIFAGATDVVDLGLRPWRVPGRAAVRRRARARRRQQRSDGRGRPRARARRDPRRCARVLRGAARRVDRRPHRHAGRRASRAVVSESSARYGCAEASTWRADRARNDQPSCWYAFFSSYIRDPTHVRPVHPGTLQFLLRASGFERVEIRYRSPLPDHVKLKTIDVDDITRWSGDPSTRDLGPLAQIINANAATLNKLLFGTWITRSIGYRS